MPGCESNPLDALGRFVESHTTSADASPASSRAAASFLRAVGAAPNRQTLSLGQALDKWVQLMHHANGNTPSVALKYIRLLHTLYKAAVKQGAIAAYDSALFPALRSRAEALGPRSASMSAMELCHHLAQPATLPEEHRMAADLVMLAVYGRGQALADVLHTPPASGSDSLPQIADIVRRNRQADQQKYAFLFDRHAARPAAITADAARRVSSMLQRVFAYAGSAAELPAQAWVEAAFAANLTDAEIRAALRQVPAAYSYLADVSPAELSAERLAELTLRVADQYACFTERWYIVRLRRTPAPGRRPANDAKGAKAKPRVTRLGGQSAISADRITAILRREKIAVEAFYPYEEIMRRIGRRRRRYARPYISDVMFLRLSRPLLGEVETLIGPYGRFLTTRTTRAAEHAVVSDGQMTSFRQAIGYLSPATEVTEETVQLPAEGSRIALRSLPLSQLFTVERVIDYTAGRSRIRLQLAMHAPDGTLLTSQVFTTTLNEIIVRS